MTCVHTFFIYFYHHHYTYAEVPKPQQRTRYIIIYYCYYSGVQVGISSRSSGIYRGLHFIHSRFVLYNSIIISLLSGSRKTCLVQTHFVTILLLQFLTTSYYYCQSRIFRILQCVSAVGTCVKKNSIIISV